MAKRKEDLISILTALLFTSFVAATSQNLNQNNQEDMSDDSLLYGKCNFSSQDNDNDNHRDSLMKRGCFCDKDCRRYGDCCIDSPYFNITEQKLADTTFECMQTSKNEGIYVKRTCPVNWTDEEIRYKCEKKDALTLPVLSQESKTTYVNVYCALCNGKNTFIFLQTQIQCQIPDIQHLKWEYSENSDMKKKAAEDTNHYFKSCTIGIKNEYGIRLCVPNLVKTCPNDFTDVQIREKCDTYTRIVKSGTTLYRNKFCAICKKAAPEFLYVSKSGRKYRSTEGSIKKMSNENSAPNNTSETISSISTLKVSAEFLENIAHNLLKVSKSERKYRSTDDSFKKLSNEDPALNTSETIPKSSPQNIPTESLENNAQNLSNECILLTRSISIKSGELLISHCSKQINSCVYTRNIPKVFDFIPEQPLLNDGVEMYTSLFYHLISLTISVISLTLHFIAFAMTYKQRTVFDKSVAALCLTMLAYYLMLVYTILVQMDTRTITCRLAAVLNQFCVLSVFSWMLMMSFDVWYTTRLACKRLQKKNHNQNHIIAYCLLGWGLPGITAFLLLLIDLAPEGLVPSSIKPKLGEDDCWRIKKDAWLAPYLFVYAPAALLLILNLVFFVNTAYLIHTSRYQTTRFEKRISMDFRFWTRLVLIVALGWLTIFMNGVRTALMAFSFCLHESTVRFNKFSYNSGGKQEPDTLVVDLWAFPTTLFSLGGFFLFLFFTFNRKYFEAFGKIRAKASETNILAKPLQSSLKSKTDEIKSVHQFS